MRKGDWMKGLPVVAASVGVAALVLAPTALADPCGSSGMFSTSGGVSTCTYTGAGTDTFTVPAGINSLDVVAIGAAGGADSRSGPGGDGASVEDTAVPVTPGDALGVTVGGAGENGFFVAGAGGTPGAGGAMPETVVGSGSTTPSSTSPPTISGTARQGQTLTESHGTWTASPTGYSYQWFDCSASGFPCTPISGATGQAYQLTASNVGHTIRVLETAQFASSSGKAVSAPTSVVTAAKPLAPQITKFKIRSKHDSAKFTFSSSGATGYECALVRHKKHKHKKPHYTSCSSPKLYQNLKAGSYTFKVKALGTGGASTTSTSQAFTI